MTGCLDHSIFPLTFHLYEASLYSIGCALLHHPSVFFSGRSVLYLVGDASSLCLSVSLALFLSFSLRLSITASFSLLAYYSALLSSSLWHCVIVLVFCLIAKKPKRHKHAEAKRRDRHSWKGRKAENRFDGGIRAKQETVGTIGRDRLDPFPCPLLVLSRTWAMYAELFRR